MQGGRDPKFLFTHLKELLGKKFDDPDVKYIQSRIDQRIVKGENDFCELEIPFTKPVICKPTDILCSFLLYVKEKAKEQMDQDFEGILMGIPPSFNELQREAIRSTMLKAKFKYVSFFEETSAVCCSYDIHPSSEPVCAAEVL